MRTGEPHECPLRTPQGPQRQRHDRRAWVRTEPTTRTVRACGGGAGAPAVGGRVRRAGLGDLTVGPRRRVSMLTPTRRNRAEFDGYCFRLADEDDLLALATVD